MAASHTYDSAGRETLLQNISSAGVGLAVFTNSYAPTDNRLTVAELDGTLVSFSYDRSSQLVNEQRSGVNAYNTTYIWDPLGNRVQQVESGLVTTRTFNSANELLTITPSSGAITTNSWDASGNLSVVNVGGALTTNTWSVENKLLNTAFSGGTSENYQYSQDGIRKTKTNSSGVTVYTMDELNVLLETTGMGALQARNTNYPEIWGGLASQYRGSASSFYGFDSQYSTRILVSVGGVVLDNYSFTGFGVVQDSGSGTANPALYGGQYGYQWDRPNWMIAGQRELDAVNGRWASRDPIGFRGGDVNLCRYVRNSPQNRIDPSGLKIVVTPSRPDDWRIGKSHSSNCCGSYNAYWLLSLSGPSQCKNRAFFVQLLSYTITLTKDCNPYGQSDLEPWYYLEVWPDPWHDGMPPPDARYGYDDGFFVGPRDESNGSQTEHGIVRYFCEEDLPPGFPDGWAANGTCRSHSGVLPCTDYPNANSLPDWWKTKDKSGGQGEHNATSTWVCCCAAEKKWSKSKATPAKTEQTTPPCNE